MVSSDVQTVVDEVIRERLDNIDIRNIDAVRDEDRYGDEVLRVTVTVNSPASDFDADSLSSLVRHLRSRLDAVHENAFPLIKYVSATPVS